MADDLERSTLDRLREASPAAFAAFVDRLAGTVLGPRGWAVECSPPSPAGGLDVVASRDGDGWFVHVRQRDADAPVEATVVRETATVARSGPHAAVLATTGGFTAAARAAAIEESVTLVDGETLADLARRAGVAIPDDPADDGESRPSLPAPAALPAAVEARTVAWPPGLRERARTLVAFVRGLGPFETSVGDATASTELDFRDAESGATVLKVRFTETSLLVFVRDPDGGFVRVAAVSIRGVDHPPTETLHATVESAVADALARARRGE